MRATTAFITTPASPSSSSSSSSSLLLLCSHHSVHDGLGAVELIKEGRVVGRPTGPSCLGSCWAGRGTVAATKHGGRAAEGEGPQTEEWAWGEISRNGGEVWEGRALCGSREGDGGNEGTDGIGFTLRMPPSPSHASRHPCRLPLETQEREQVVKGWELGPPMKRRHTWRK